MLCHMELAGGAESLAETIAELPRAELLTLEIRKDGVTYYRVPVIVR